MRQMESGCNGQEPELGPVRNASICLIEARAEVLRSGLDPQGLPAEALDREALYAEFQPLVRRLIRQYGRTPELRGDLEGEIYCRFCAFLHAFDPQRGIPLKPYLVRQLTATTYTYARQHWRVASREFALQEAEVECDFGGEADPTEDWLQSICQQEMASQLPGAMERLPRRQRQVVIWRYYEERSFEEIASTLGVQPATVRSLLRHGLNNLRKYLAGPDTESTTLQP